MKTAHTGKEAEVTRTLLLWGLIAILLVTFAIWLWQDFNYPHTIYEYIQTDKFVSKYEGRVGGFAVEAVPIWEPDNPPWVNFLREWAIRIMLILGFSILIVGVSFGAKKKRWKVD